MKYIKQLISDIEGKFSQFCSNAVISFLNPKKKERKCNCSLTIKLTGSGCDVCNPGYTEG